MSLRARALPLCLLMLLLALPAVADEAGLDVRLVVDISGSMKQNDPNNLRRPAMRLIAELLRDGSQAGVWTFGQYVNMLVPHGKVDDQWRQYALSRISAINSVALRTNIGGALEVASDDFYRDRRRDDTHFILLTDGMVDIAPASMPEADARSRAERKRILEEVVPRLAAKGAHIHAIALSGNADLSLLKQMALATGGSYSIAETDEELSRSFLDALERAAPTEEVPLEANRFSIDDSISEFTAVIFHDPGKSAIGLRSPAGTEHLKREPAGDESIRWVSGNDYTLVTVEDPAGGEWEILGELGEGSRVKVISDLTMAVTDLPAYFFASEELPLNVAFEAAGEVIIDPGFLRLLTVTVKLRTDDGRTGAKVLSSTGANTGANPEPAPNAVPEDGVYRDLISKLKQPGEYTFTVIADGKTFQRQSRQTIVLRPPLEVNVEGQGVGAESRYAIDVTVGQPDLVPEQTRVAARVTGPDKGTEVVQLNRKDNGIWTHNLSGAMGEGEYSVVIELWSQTTAGEKFVYASAPLSLSLPRSSEAVDYQTLVAPAPESRAVPPAAEPATAVPVDSGTSTAVPESAPEALAPDLPPAAERVPEEAEAPAEVSPQAAAEPETGTVPWLWIGTGGGLAGVLVAALGWLVYRKKRMTSAATATDTAAPEETPGEEERLEEAPVPETDAVDDEESADPDGNSAEEQPPELDDAQGAEYGDGDDTDSLVDQIMAQNADAQSEADHFEAEKSPEDELPQLDQEEEDEFSLEDFDLTDVDEPPADADDYADGADGEVDDEAGERRTGTDPGKA